MVDGSFATELARAVTQKGTAALVGLDPRREQLPDSLQPADGSAQAVAESYRSFCQTIIDIVAPLVPAIKPQAAFFEQLGPHGYQALAEITAYAKQAGLVAILDGKRNDIGSTGEAYADAYLGADRHPWSAHALTVNPYLGEDSLTPFAEACQARNAGIFVLVKTSNRGGGMLQDLVADGKPVYQHVAELVEQMANRLRADEPYGPIGAVVGATYPTQLAELRALMPHAWILVPGYGSQGGTAADVAAAFDSDGLGGLVNSSRGIIFAHRRDKYARFGSARWEAAVEQATRDMIDDLGQKRT